MCSYVRISAESVSAFVRKYTSVTYPVFFYFMLFTFIVS